MYRVGRRRQTDKHLPPRVYRKHGALYFVPKPAEQERYGGSWIYLHTDESLAVQKYYQLIDPAEDSLGAIWQWYSNRWLVKNAPRTQGDKRKYWEVLALVFGRCHPDSLEPGDIYDYLDKRESQGAGVQGNREIALLSHMYTKAIQKRLARFNPCLRVERNEECERTLDVTADMLMAWISFAPEKLGLATELMFMTGLRSPDVLKIKLQDLTERGLRFTAGKTGKTDWYPWTDDLRSIVKDLKATHKRRNGTRLISEYLVCNHRGRAYSKSGFDSIWQKAMRKFAAAGHERFAPNDCRAAHAAELDDQGGDATRNLQHSTRLVTERHYQRRGRRLETLRRVK